MATFKIGKVLLNSLFGKPATLMYPVVPREWEERTRGHIEIDTDTCILCGICSKKCPTNAITVDRDDNIKAFAAEALKKLVLYVTSDIKH